MMYFSKTENNIFYLYDYFPVKYMEHAGVSEMLVRFKEGDKQAVDYFINAMSDAMEASYAKHKDILSNMVICIMPSHIERQYSLGLAKLSKELGKKFNLIDATYLIERTITQEKKSQGGNRSVEASMKTLRINGLENLSGRNVLLLDDITTTGYSIEAARQLLINYGANAVYAQTIGRTKKGTPKIDYILESSEYEFSIEMNQSVYPRTMVWAKQILKQQFGYDSFKSGQKEVINNILENRDCLAIMPTGGGKSLCYQVPALLSDGISIVVSPLISLMQDQVNSLKMVGIETAYVNSFLSDAEIETVMKNACRGLYKILYVAPERLCNSVFLAFSKRAKIAMVVVDEAHCISHWGMDFRPSYLKIGDYIDSLGTRPIVCAFTATATEEVKKDIVQFLRMRTAKVVQTGFNRENLYFSVETNINKEKYIVDYIRKHPFDSGVIYCSTRQNVEFMFEYLHEKGISVSRYHGGLERDERRRNQEEFIYDKKLIMVATNAFGMGIDKSNVRFVIHYNMPQSIENYYQEAGRAGRDGEKATCIMLYSHDDVSIQKKLLAKKLFAEVPSQYVEEIKARDKERLKAIEGYCTTTGCLRNYILNYFGEENNEPCDDCGNCYRYDQLIDEENRVIFGQSSLEQFRNAPLGTGKDVRTDNRTVLTEAGHELFEILRLLRMNFAREEAVPPYMIFSDKTLIHICILLPRSKSEMLNIFGVGEKKYEKYGESILKEVGNFVKKNREITYNSDVAFGFEGGKKRNRTRSYGKKKTYKDWEKEYPGFVIIKREGYFWACRGESAKLISGILGYKLGGDMSNPSTGSPNLGNITAGLRKENIKYIVVESGEIIEMEEFNIEKDINGGPENS